ncbi:MAG: hypothetical protein EZS28_024150 [Streblomastix strix]|uniref:Uncharacterized protein n=1 Tax=Streblomastix strix TaxID=222440 RepID=A0A5J4VCT3_9EUKA|nr:MAG: hypothetical protein EZS28_024150 [Streblomastix strix]
MANVIQAENDVQASEIDFQATNIQDEKNNEAGEGRQNALHCCPLHRYQYQMKYQTRTAVRSTNFCGAYKRLHYTISQQVREYLYICGNNKQEQQAIDVPSQMILHLSEAENAF